MPSRLIRINLTTRIFEESTDNGANFNPAALDAAILTQGTIDPARMPTGIPTGGGNNVFTGVNRFSAADVIIQFNETDQGSGQKNWRFNIATAVFGLDTLDDAFATPVNLLNITRNGILTLNAQAAGAHSFACNANGSFELRLRNSNSGSSALTSVSLGNNGGAAAARFLLEASGAAGSAPYDSNRAIIDTSLAEGLALNASNVSGIIDFFTGGSATRRLRLTSAGDAVFNGTITERGRSTPVGEWITYTPTWASGGTQPTLGNGTITGRYTRIGKTTFVNVYLVIGSTTTFGTSTYTFSLPTTAVASSPSFMNGGNILIFDASAGVFLAPGSTELATSTTLFAFASTGSAFTGTNPVTLATSDQARISGCYEEA